MSVVDDRLDAADLALLARMHVDALPGSLVSLVGERYARWFYRYLARSPEELVLVERDARTGALQAACIVSLAPETLARRLLYRTPLSLWAPFALARLPWRSLVHGLFAARGAAETQPAGPEILLIFTVPALRGRGVGARLLGRCEALLAGRGLTRLLVKTRDEASNQALRFYERAAFTRARSLGQRGKRLVLFEKPLR